MSSPSSGLSCPICRRTIRSGTAQGLASHLGHVHPGEVNDPKDYAKDICRSGPALDGRIVALERRVQQLEDFLSRALVGFDDGKP